MHPGRLHWGPQLAPDLSRLCPSGRGPSKGCSQELGDSEVTANSLPPDSAVSLPRLPWGQGWAPRAMSRKGILGQRGVRGTWAGLGLLPRARGAELRRPAQMRTHRHTHHTPAHTHRSPHPPRSARSALPLPGWGHPAVMEPGAGPHSGGQCRQTPPSSLPDKGLGGTLPLSGPTCPLLLRATPRAREETRRAEQGEAAGSWNPTS